MTTTRDRDETPGTTGLLLHNAARYDLLVWLATFGKERAFRERLLSLAAIAPGESVLDVGCGTGTLAIAAKRRVGPGGSVRGIDASPEMIARANRKAEKAGVDVVFTSALAESLPFPDAEFDVVSSTVMLHHLPRKARLRCVAEMRRVVKPGGRVFVVDFESSTEKEGGFLAHFHARHGHVGIQDVIAMLGEAGLRVTNSGAVGIRTLHFVLASAPSSIAAP